MQKITALKVQKKNPNRINVHLDGEFAFGLARIVAAWLRVGQELSNHKITELLAQDAEELAYQRALKLISYRPRSETEVKKNLLKHKVSDHVISSTLARLRKARLVDDRAFAHAWVENRTEFRPRGKFALRYELRNKGIEEAIIDEILESIDEEHLAYKASEKKSRQLKNLEEKEFKKKLTAFLSRRGFNYDTANLTVAKFWQDSRDKDIK
ncbi:MAG: RecX family transcriptional regulator [Planctomycetota bacterium]|jgi:regulatory protein